MVDNVSDDVILELEKRACRIRQLAVQTVYDGGSGHCGGSLSVSDILSVLFFHEMRYRADAPMWRERDRFVLSKGHACPALYATLAEAGYFPHSELKRLRSVDALLQGHPEYGIPGIETPTGSLGQGFSAALGMALGARLAGIENRVYVILGDGEVQEGQVWEAAMAAAHHKVDKLTAFIDRNGLQGDGLTEEIMSEEPLADKWIAFGWEVREVDGHDIAQLIEAFDWARSIEEKPQMIIAHTTKGKGVSFMEHVAAWHGTAPPTDEELACALRELAGSGDAQ